MHEYTVHRQTAFLQSPGTTYEPSYCAWDTREDLSLTTVWVKSFGRGMIRGVLKRGQMLCRTLHPTRGESSNHGICQTYIRDTPERRGRTMRLPSCVPF